MAVANPEPYYTVDQAKVFLGFESAEGVRKAIRDGRIRAKRRGKKTYVIPASAIREFQEALEPVGSRGLTNHPDPIALKERREKILRERRYAADPELACIKQVI